MTALATFTHLHRVEFCETDMAGIVHFANFYRYMEQAEHEFFRSLGLSVMEHEPDGSIVGWPRVSCSCNYEAPAFFEDLVEVRLTVTRKGVKSLCYDVEFVRGETRLARGKMKTVCCRFKHGEPMKSIAMPVRFDERIGESPAVSERRAGGAAEDLDEGDAP